MRSLLPTARKDAGSNPQSWGAGSGNRAGATRLDDVSKLVGDALHCEPERARPFAQLVQEKTGGNPFFAIQFFTAMAEEGLLGFDSVSRAWQWDINRIRAKSYTDNVVDLMAGKLMRLSHKRRKP